MMNKILYRVLSALAVLVGLCSCGLEEPYGTSQNGVIEFVARPLGFNNQSVETKSEASPLENKVCNCYFLLFNSSGERVHISGGIASSLQSYRIPKIDGLTGTLTACYLVNVPPSFANNIIGLTKPANAPDSDNYKYINTAVLENLTYNSGTPMGVPLIDVNGDGTADETEACIPMFGKESFNLANNSNTIVCQVPIKRLFAKLTVSISLDVNKESWLDQAASTLTYYKLNYYTLHNLPTKVRLQESEVEEQSPWVSDEASFAYTTEITMNSSGNIDASIYNKSSNTNYQFDLYTPEYYLSPKDLEEGDVGYMDENYKPQNYPSGTFPIYITLNGYYMEYSYRSAGMTHKIYFGRDEYSDFSLARNTRYVNYVTIKGVSENADDQDHMDLRVTTNYINNPVAQAGQSANCYIISNAGDYSFPAYKGAYKRLQDGIFCDGDEDSYVELIAKDNTGIVLQSLDYDEDKNFISFNVSSIADGNAVIALKNGNGSIEWSWHLWCKTGSQYDIFGWGNIDTQNYPNGSVMMDRNLGASGSDSKGLYYKYGNKNPYLGTAYDYEGNKINSGYYGSGGSESNTWDPASDSNSNDITKAVNDPCPPGYRIPSQGDWRTGSGDNGTSEVMFVYNDLNPSVRYYYNGYLNASFKEVNSETESKPVNADGFTRSSSSSSTSSPVESSDKKKQTRTKTETEVSYYDFVYKLPQAYKRGIFWCSNGYAYIYDYNTLSWSDLDYNSMEIISCKSKSRTTTIQQERTRRFTSIPWNDLTHWWSDVSSSQGNWSSEITVTDKSTINNDTWRSLLFLSEMGRGKVFSSTTDYIILSNDPGAQVRCIVDPVSNQ